jgi:hypothetical protein
MPTYKNTSQNDVAIGGLRVSPGESVESLVVFPTTPAGITKTSDLPIWNPIIVSEVYTKNTGQQQIITLPVMQSGRIMLKCTDGTVEVKFNDSAFSPVLKLTENSEPFERQLLDRWVTQIIIDFTTSPSTVEVLVTDS